MTNLLETAVDAMDTHHPQQPITPWLGFRFDKRANALFPKLEVFTLSVARIHPQFILWRPSYPQIRQVSSTVPVADTGILWDFVDSVKVHYFHRHLKWLLDAGVKGTSRPFWPRFIGFHGYSDGFRSHGGQWAGFRYFVDTGRVQFSPLHWEEVK